MSWSEDILGESLLIALGLRVADPPHIPAPAITGVKYAFDAFDAFVEHLQHIDCAPEDVAFYLRLSRQVLATLYLQVAAGNYEPAAIEKLALRFALDARRPVEAPVSKFSLDRQDVGWEVWEPLPDPDGSARVHSITNPFVTDLLDCVFADPIRIPEMMAVIVDLLGKVPEDWEGLPGINFEWQLSGGVDQRLDLWINRKPVALGNGEAIHKLLTTLCRQADKKHVGRQLEKDLEISNVSQAVATIRAALRDAFPDAEHWLQTEPLCWADGHAPSERS